MWLSSSCAFVVFGIGHLHWNINGEVLAQIDHDWRGFGFEVGFWHLPFFIHLLNMLIYLSFFIWIYIINKQVNQMMYDCFSLTRCYLEFELWVFNYIKYLKGKFYFRLILFNIITFFILNFFFLTNFTSIFFFFDEFTLFF